MRTFALLAALAVASACSTTTTVRGTVLVDTGAPQPEAYEYEATESHSTTGLAALCFVTAYFYGGACWAYLALPFDDHEALAMSNANLDVMRIGKCAILMSPVVSGGGPGGTRQWALKRNGATVNPFEVNKLCDPRPVAAPAPVAPPPSPSPAPQAPAS
jgi:hypothetical protein